MKVFVLLAVVGAAYALPAPAPQFAGIRNFFKNLGGGDKAADEEDAGLERVPYKTLNKTKLDDIAFEIREYPSVKWVCTELTYEQEAIEEEDEVLNSEDEVSAIKYMQQKMSGGWKKKPSSGMFMKLFRYISGVNVERQEVAMTSPVLTKMVPMENNMMSKDMCFYLDSAAQDSPPTPEEEDVRIVVSKPLTVAVYEFGGYAMSDSVWAKNAAMFADKLGDRMNSVEQNWYYTAGYDSPMKFWNRRNEVMFQLKK